MADHDRRQYGGGGGSHNSRKRRYRDDDEYDRRPSRRKVDNAPPPVRIRNQLLSLAESPLRHWHVEAQSIAHLVSENYDNQDVRNGFLDLVLQLIVEQPLKIPFVAAVVLMTNTLKPDAIDEILSRTTQAAQEKIKTGEWRDVKLHLKFLACLQSCLSGDGVFPVLEELFNRAVDLQTASSEDTIGTELVKIILLTIPYVMSTAPDRWQQKAAEVMDKTEIIAGEPHTLQALVDPYQPAGQEESPAASMSLIGLLQKQLQAEAADGWKLACLPRPWKLPLEEIEAQEKLDSAPKHDLPVIDIPSTVVVGPKPLFPEIYFSVYAHQDAETVPRVTNIASVLIRDGLLDTINILDFNRNVVARYLIDLDCYFSENTFVKRATPFDRLKDVEAGKSTWKPEDVAVDAVFSQLFQLPRPEHKPVYYHSVLTEACKIAPAAIAPSLGRAIRYLYRNAGLIDLELSSRFLDWFAHHLSNFGFTWKWTEWVSDISLPDFHPRKAIIIGAIDKEIRLSFAQRIKKTLPEEYQPLIGPEKETDVPDFKFSDAHTPFSAEGQEIASLLKTKSPDEEFQPTIERIHAAALDGNLDPLVASTDVFMTSVCWVGSKSLSHVLACIDRTKLRLVDVGVASEAARAQIISSVMAYWHSHPGTAITIIEKLLNYSVLTPLSVIEWALVGSSHANGNGSGDALAQPHVFEMVCNTVSKVTSRVRQVHAPGSVGTSAETVEEERAREVRAMRELFRAMDDALVSWATGSKDELMEEGDGTSEREALIRRWGERWLRVFRRKAAIEESFLLDAARDAGVPVPNGS